MGAQLVHDVESVVMPKRPKNESGEVFRRNLVRFREEMGLARDAAAERMGISSKYLYLLEAGQRGVPRLDVLRRIARTYGRRIDDLDSADPPPADRGLMPLVTFSVHVSPEEQELLADELTEVYDELDRINQRLRSRLAELLKRPGSA